MHIKNKEWVSFFKKESEKPYFQNLNSFLLNEYKNEKVIYPAKPDIFRVYESLSPKDIKVVIIGQDPYYNEGQAHGLAFSVKDGIKIPPSLRNIFKELESTIEDFASPKSGNLLPWVEQGVFLLNNVLTVESGKPDSHKNKGWEKFTNATIEYINDNCENVVFVLWGGNAKKKEKMLNKEKHLVLMSAHPSPLSSYRGFFGSNQFNLINDYLDSNNLKKINWNL